MEEYIQFEKRSYVAPLKYFVIPNETIGKFKPRMIYLLGAMYASAHYRDKKDKRLTTNITIDQLASITGESRYYIKDVFLPYIRKNPTEIIRWEGNYYTAGMKKRNSFTLLNPKENFRIIWSDIFQDKRFTAEEKGYIIALYSMCANNTFRYELSNNFISKRIGVSLNTWKKFKTILEKKGVILTFNNAPVALIDTNFEQANILLYKSLGHKTALDMIAEFRPDEDTIEHINVSREIFKHSA